MKFKIFRHVTAKRFYGKATVVNSAITKYHSGNGLEEMVFLTREEKLQVTRFMRAGKLAMDRDEIRIFEKKPGHELSPYELTGEEAVQLFEKHLPQKRESAEHLAQRPEHRF